ncbi:MAG: metallophosphoesterase [Candidatus Cryptobacteroides sp.]
MDRRDFLKKSAVLTAAAAAPGLTFARSSQEVQERQAGERASAGAEGGPLIDTPPVLQNYAGTSMGIAFGVSAMANGYVEYSESPDLQDAVRVKCGGYRVTGMNQDVMQVRLTGLKEATKYYYRIGADRIRYDHGYSMHITGNETDPRIYSFTTAGRKAEAHFCVINDTHGIDRAFVPVVDKLKQLSPSCVVWNGDVYDKCEDVAKQKAVFLRSPLSQGGVASNVPLMFCPGNHDSRGLANRQLEKVWMFRQPEERESRDWDLGRNFAVRMGDVAMIGLDTAEDKLDENPLFAGLFNSGAYREAQAEWLKDALKRKEISSAPFLVAFCHIPIFCSDPSQNPGDIHPADSDPSRYSTDYAAWQRTCHDLWGPLLHKAGCNLVIAGHSHVYRYDAPDRERCWTQIVGGGPVLQSEGASFPTVIEGMVEDRKLVVTVHNIAKDTVQERFVFNPRR